MKAVTNAAESSRRRERSCPRWHVKLHLSTLVYLPRWHSSLAPRGTHFLEGIQRYCQPSVQLVANRHGAHACRPPSPCGQQTRKCVRGEVVYTVSVCSNHLPDGVCSEILRNCSMALDYNKIYFIFGLACVSSAKVDKPRCDGVLHDTLIQKV